MRLALTETVSTDSVSAAKRSDPPANALAVERELDERVYRLYGLTADDIKIVEEVPA